LISSFEKKKSMPTSRAKKNNGIIEQSTNTIGGGLALGDRVDDTVERHTRLALQRDGIVRLAQCTWAA
jgi:hypothetical protein